MKKITIKILLILLSFLGIISVNSTYAATITSTSTGGSWSSSGTWIGGIIPGQNDDVVIQGNVTSGVQLVNNVLINSGVILNINGAMIVNGSLVNNGTIRPTVTTDVTVNGNILNNGTINNYSSNTITIKSYGNINNTGTWSPYNTYLEGGTIGTKEVITNNSIGGYVYYSDNLEITGNPTFNGNLYANNKTLSLNNGNKLIITGTYLGNGRISGNGGELDILGTIAGNFSGSLNKLNFLTGSANINGNIISKNFLISSGATLNINGTAYLSGTLINSGTIRPAGGELSLTGNITNFGTLVNYISGNYLSFRAYGNITNYGSWNPYYTYLEGGNSNSKEIISNNPIGGYIYYSDNLEITGNPTFNGNVYANNKTLTLNNGNKLIITGTYLGNGRISGTGGELDILGTIAGNFSGSLNKINFLTGSANINGNIISKNFLISSGATLNINGTANLSGTLINSGTIRPGGGELSLTGNVTNFGTLVNYISGNYLTFKVYGDIVNNGSWNTYSTYSYGKITNNLYWPSSSTYIGTMNSITNKEFDTLTPIGGNVYFLNDFEVLGNPKFSGTVYANNRNITLNNGNKLILQGGMNGNGRFSGSGGELDVSGVLGGTLTGSLNKINFLSGAITAGLNGNIIAKDFLINSGAIVNIVGTTYLSGTLINSGTIRPAGGELSLTGNITNFGTLVNYISGNYLSFRAYGNITNYGSWNPYYTYLEGGNSNSKEIISNNPIGGYIYYSDNLEITGNPTFNGNLYANNKTLTLNNGNKLIITGTYLGNGRISGTGGELDILGTIAGNFSGSLNKLNFLTGSANINGNIISKNFLISSGATLNINGTAYLSGTLINSGTIRPAGGELSLTGNITNFGTLVNYISGNYLSFRAYGNITNYGSWNPYYTYLEGGNSNSKEIISNNPIGGYIYYSDNLEITGNPTFNGNVYANNKTLTLNNGNKLIITGTYLGNGRISGNGGELDILGTITGTFSGSLNKINFSSGSANANGNITSKSFLVSSGVTLNINGTATLNGNVTNRGTIRANGGGNELNLKGNIINFGTISNYISNILYVKIYGNLENNGIWNTTYNYLKWEPINGASSYYLTIVGYTGTTVPTNEYLLQPGVLSLSNKSWYALGSGTITSSKCINVPGCILSNGETNPLSPPVINPFNPFAYNNGLYASLNINTSPNLLPYSSTYVKNDNNQMMCKINESTSEGDPVRLNTGEFDYDNTLISYNSEGMPFDFKIKYKNKAYYNGPIGNNFDFNYNIYLTEDGSGNINFHDGKLGAFKFTKTSTGYLYNDTINASLTQSGTIYTINFDSQRSYKFGSNFKIETIKDNYGNEIKLTYNDNKELTKIRDTLGREYIVSYYSNSRFKDITDFAGNKVEFIYFGTGETLGSQNDLKTIKMTNSGSIREIGFTYTTGSTFEAAHNIVKLIDSENNTYVENTYDSQDRVSEQKYGNDKIYYDYYMDSGNNYIEKNVVTDRVGNVITYFYNSAGNTVKKLIHKNSGDLEYNYVYDSKGNLIKEIKPLGNGTEYLYDSNNNIIETRIKADMSASGSSSDIVSNATYDLRFNKPTQIVSANGLVTNFTYDNNGNVLTKEILGVKDFEDNNLTITGSYVYNSKGQLIKEINAKGLETTFEYGSGNLVKIKKGTGSTAIENNFEYDTKGNLVKSIDGLGKETTLTYDDFNLIIQKLSPEAIKTNFTYNKINKKTNEKIVLGTGSGENLNIDYEYDILDNITKQVQDINENKKLTINNKYDDNGKIIETQAGSGVAIKYLYDQNGLIVEKKMETGPTNGDIVTSYTYDSNERIIKETNPRGKETNYEYDSYDRIIKKTLSDGSYEKYYYDKASNIVKIEKKDDGNNILAKEENIYDKRNKIISNLKYVLSDSGATQTSYAKYDENGNLIEKIDPKGNEITYSYDIFDRLTQTQDSLGNKIINTYDKNNNIVSKKVKQSNNKETTTTYAYDDDNRVISETNELNKTKHYEYNKIGQIVKVTDENGNFTDYTYNYDGKLVSEKKHVESENLTTTYEYDERGNMIQVTDAKGNVTTYDYDNLSRIIKQTYPDNKELTYTYDKNSNIKTKTDPNGTTVTNTYDDLDRLISRSISTGSGVAGVISENYTYDELGRLISATDSNNHNLSFTYDSLNRLLQENQSGSIVGYSYDNNNNLLSITNPSNNLINYTYDDINRVTSIKKNSDSIADYTYTGLENTSIALGNSTSITKIYDELSRLSSLNNLAKTYNYSYDDVGNITSDSFKNYDYDEIYRLTGVSNSGGTLESLSYDKAGNRINNFNSLVGNGANYEYVTNNLNQYVSSSGNVNRYVIEEIISELEGKSSGGSGSGETESGSGSETGTGETNSGSGKENNGSGEIETGSGNIINENTGSGETESSSGETNSGTTIEESSSGSTQEENDTGSGEETNSGSGESGSGVAVGILKKSSGIVYGTSEEESSSGIITYSGGLVNFDDSSNYTYDNNGNIINNGKYKFIYDYKNRIIEVTSQSDETIVQYEYDILDRRYKKESNSKLVEYTFSNENILEENITNSGSSTITKEYINGLGTDDLIAYDLDSIRYYFNLNHLGSVDGITDNSGVTLISYEYDSYGNTFVNNSGSLVEVSSYTGSTYENYRLYTGREYDGEINLYYLRARYYDSKIGRFISRDPIDISDDVNLYSYVGNNPVNYLDLMGLERMIIPMATNQFNRVGHDMEMNHYFYDYNPVEMLLKGPTYFITRNIFASPEDTSFGDVSFAKNILLWQETKGKSNIKASKKFMMHTETYPHCNPDGNDGCYFSLTDKETNNKHQALLADIGNMALFYNGQKMGFSYDYIAAVAMTQSLAAGARENISKEDVLANEKEDEIFYRAGYELAKNTKTGEMTQEQFREALLNAVKQIPGR